MTKIEISKLKPHPKNPRLVMREDVIAGIEAGLKASGFHESYSLQVWPDGDDFVILSGHHRVEAAKRAGLTEVPCFVRDELDEEAAYMVLATANAQGELSPLEEGIHFNGSGMGVREYARMTGQAASGVTYKSQAGKVFSQLNTESDMRDKTQHLAAIHSLPQECWKDCAEHMLAKGLSAKDTKALVDTAEACPDNCHPIHATALFTGKTTGRELARIKETFDRAYSALEYEETMAEFMGWWIETVPIDIKDLQSKRIEIETKESDRREAEREPTPEVEPDPLPNLVLADPPWRYDFAETDNRQIENHYPSATVDEIIDMRPETQPDCVLFLWATVAKLREAFEVLDGWGYEYKTHSVWDKEKIGMGYWFRGQHELLIVATKGKFSPPEQENRVSSVFREPRGKHSAKPECVYQWIEKAFPQAVKLEMFCRSPRAGWKTFGNES
jgi:N6-adenosine-specific RNA methylase IME4